MMSSFKSASYDSRSVEEWLERAGNGLIALPSFQRSYVWKKNQTIADYLFAVFEGRPTGIFLVLETGDKPQFPSRTLKGVGSQVEKADELLLDGQQRLTSLWKAFNGETPVAYYVEVKNLKARDLLVKDVVFYSNNSATGKAMRDSRKAYEANRVPVNILLDRSTPENGLGEIWQWCKEALGGGDESRLLEKTIAILQKQLLMRRELYYCSLGSETEKHAAIEIFVQSNKSSVKVNEFDIAVALALKGGDESLRERINDFHQQSEVIRHYFNVDRDDDERMIGPLGEWLLFGACLSVKNVAPRKRHFEAVINDIFSGAPGEADLRLNRLLENIEAALNTVADHGVPTRDTLPALPPLHVLVGLQDDLRKVKRPGSENIYRRLISAYLWRSFFTDRYEANANDHLYEDYKALRETINDIQRTGAFNPDVMAPIFDESEYPLPGIDELGSLDKPVPWIRGRSRLGRAVVALSLHQSPIDWFTGAKLDARKVRELVAEHQLDRHHVFPRNILKTFVPEQEMNHGLNGVLLGKRTNQAFSKKDPAEYIRSVLVSPGAPKEKEVRRRVESHFVPYDEIVRKGPVKERYRRFIETRAKIIVKRIGELSTLPGS